MWISDCFLGFLDSRVGKLFPLGRWLEREKKKVKEWLGEVAGAGEVWGEPVSGTWIFALA